MSVTSLSVTSLAKEARLLNKPAEEQDIMEQILEHLGGMGTYQRYLFVMMMPIMFIFSFVYGVQMFVTATPQQHWCRVPELMHLDVDLRRNLSIPGASSGLDWDRCSVFDANWTAVLANMTPPSSDTPTVPCQHGWEFLYDDIPYTTIVSEREWVCEKASYAPTAQALFFVGSLIGSGMFGWMGDKFGRVPALVGSNIVGCVGGIASAYTSGFWDFSFCRFLVGLCNDSGFMMMYIIVLEYVGPNQRSFVSNLSMGLFFGTGGVLLPIMAYVLKDWRMLMLLSSVPMLLVLAAPWVVPESASWLASIGKVKRAVKVLKKFERVNKAEIPEDILQKFVVLSSKKVETDESMSALMRSSTIRNNMFCLIFVVSIVGIIIDAIIRLSENIGPNFFVTYALSSVIEIPALLLVALILDRLGRRFLSFLTIFTAGVLCLVCATVPQGLPQLVLALMMRFSVNMSLGVIMQLSTEVLPTGLRALGSSIIHMTMFVATILSPYIVYSGNLWRNLPLVILGVMGLMGGGVSLLLPETKGKPMPQTIADGERLIRENRLCGKPEKNNLEDQDVVFLDNKKAIGLG